MIEKRTKEVVVGEETTIQEYFVETIIETKELEISVDSIDSQITQKTNTINNLQLEITALEAKKQEILALN